MTSKLLASQAIELCRNYICCSKLGYLESFQA